ncbi:M48 family metallopeptidase [Luedemannella flava]
MVLILLAIELRPRLGRLSAADRRLTRTQTPTLFGLIDEVAGAVGGPVPDVVVVSEQVNASAGVVGPGKRVLVLGLPLWAVLPAQHRVALLGHELAHFVNGDVRRLPLVRVATTTLGGLAGLLRFPELDGTVGPVAWLVRGLAWAARSTVLAVHLVLVWIGLRDAQRAEYRADEVAAEVAGSAASRDHQRPARRGEHRHAGPPRRAAGRRPGPVAGVGRPGQGGPRGPDDGVPPALRPGRDVAVRQPSADRATNPDDRVPPVGDREGRSHRDQIGGHRRGAAHALRVRPSGPVGLKG